MYCKMSAQYSWKNNILYKKSSLIHFDGHTKLKTEAGFYTYIWNMRDRRWAIDRLKASAIQWDLLLIYYECAKKHKW